jgi:hypothetical protein
MKKKERTRLRFVFAVDVCDHFFWAPFIRGSTPEQTEEQCTHTAHWSHWSIIQARAFVIGTGILFANKAMASHYPSGRQ